MNKIVTTISALILASAALPAAARGLADWEIVCDGNRKAQLSQVVCLMAADNDELFNVVLQDSSIDGVSSVSFQKFSGIESVGSDPTSMRIIQAEGVLRIMNCRPGASLVISDLAGKIIGRHIIADGAIELDIRSFVPGPYVASIDGRAIKFIKK